MQPHEPSDNNQPEIGCVQALGLRVAYLLRWQLFSVWLEGHMFQQATVLRRSSLTGSV